MAWFDRARDAPHSFYPRALGRLVPLWALAYLAGAAAGGRLRAILPRAALLVLVGAAVTFSLVSLGVAGGLPDPTALERAEVPYSTQVYDRTGGRLLYVIEEERREYAKLAEVPPVLRDATIAIEDRSFWTNPGIDVGGIVRAALANQREGRVAQGASTITQQLVRARLFDEEQSLDRKIREAITAVRVTMRYSKDDILEMYLNQVYYGNHSYGVRTAAKSYFGIEDLAQLTLGQAALLAGLPQQPSRYDPVVDPEAARARRDDVLAAMVRAGSIDDAAARAAAAEPIAVRPAQTPLAMPHAVFRVRDELERLLGPRAVATGGLRVYTTIDPGLQKIAERAVRDRVRALGGSNVHNGALVSLDPRTGEILAYVGSVDYADQDPRVRGAFDVAGLGERQVGSTFKLFTYLTALRAGFTPATVLWDVETNFSPPGQPAYRPQDASPTGSGPGPQNGPVTIRQAIRESLNIPAIKVTALVGTPAIEETARLLGVRREWDPERIGLSFGIGANEMTLRELASAYQVVANMGLRIEPTLIMRVDDRDGKVLVDRRLPKSSKAISPQLAWLMTDMLKDTTDPGASPIFGSWTTIGRPAALKTGTTDDLKDVFAVGYTPELLTAVWLGNSNNEPMRGISSAMGPGVLWREFMRAGLAHFDIAPSWYARPEGILERTVCVRPGLTGGVGSGLLPSASCPSGWRTLERFVAGTEPKADDAAFWGKGCVNAVAERPEWQADLLRWAASGRTARLGMPICGFGPSLSPPASPRLTLAPPAGKGKKGRD